MEETTSNDISMSESFQTTPAVGQFDTDSLKYIPDPIHNTSTGTFMMKNALRTAKTKSRASGNMDETVTKLQKEMDMINKQVMPSFKFWLI